MHFQPGDSVIVSTPMGELAGIIEEEPVDDVYTVRVPDGRSPLLRYADSLRLEGDNPVIVHNAGCPNPF